MRLAVLVVAAACVVATAGEDVDSLRAREAEALREAARTCHEIARRVPSRRIAEIEHAFRLDPDAPAPGRAEDPGPADPGALVAAQHGVGLAAIAAAARSWDEAGGREAFDRMLGLALGVYDEPDVAAAFGLQWSDPYDVWMHPRDARRIDEGWERVGGEWLDPDSVARLDARRAADAGGSDVSDGALVVRSTLPVRDVLRILATGRRVRGRLASWFPALRDRAPRVRLPVLVAASRESLERVLGPRAADARFAALYVRPPEGVGAVVASPEVRLRDGSVESVTTTELLWVLRHELTHQVLHEAFREPGAPFDADAHAWLVEGLASYAAEWEAGPDGDRLRVVATRPLGSGTVPGPFAATQAASPLAAPAEIVTWGRAEFAEPAAYRSAAVFVHFLMDGGDASRRARLAELVADVHVGRGPERTFDAVFPGDDPARMAAEFREFTDGMKAEER